MDRIIQLRREHREARFPDLRGEEIDGIDLVLLDADIVGCVDTFLEGKHLDARRIAILERCHHEASKIARRLRGSDVEYFERLGFLAHAVLAQIKIDGGAT
jgi:hypothetical protein